MNTIGKPCEGKLQARFDEGGTANVRYLFIFVGRLYSTAQLNETGDKINISMYNNYVGSNFYDQLYF